MSRAKGDVAEAKAVAFLEDLDYTIVEKNFYSRFGEVDIIATKENVLHFVEVKSGDDYELAIQNITPQKLLRLIKTIHVYIKKYSCESDFVLDAIVVTSDELFLVENITL